MVEVFTYIKSKDDSTKADHAGGLKEQLGDLWSLESTLKVV